MAGSATMSLKQDSEIEGMQKRRRRPIWIFVAVVLAIASAVAVVVAVLISQNIIPLRSGSGTASGATSDSAPATTSDSASVTAAVSSSVSLPATSTASATTSSTSSAPKPTACSTKEDIPAEVRGTYLDPTSWLEMTGLNCTYTNVTVGDLPIAGLNSTWDNSKRANSQVPSLNEPWGSYTSRPIRGVNLGGWLSLEPFITPSLFNYDSNLAVVDEWSLCTHLGKDAAATLEKHYATFITEQDFKNIAAAGLDHIRIPFSYWAVQTYDSDPYVFRTSWRYLLRGIEWARKYGLRINLDLHALPGSQNGWNHSGRQGTMGWKAGPDGALNAQRSLEIHDRLSKFFAQDRYKNIVAFYGLANEPAKELDLGELISWTADAYKIVRGNGVNAIQIFSDSLRGLPPWQGKLTGYADTLVVDAHNYAIFDPNLISMKHSAKVSFACDVWGAQMRGSMNTATGFGPTMVGEWSQADTDCTKHLNGVGNGARWNGTFYGTIGSPKCPTGDSQCSCDMANADPSTYTAEYKLFLKTWATAQMDAFEKSWGWFYWTWKSESAPLWSYKAGLEGNFMPAVAYERDWDCSKPIPSFGNLPETY